MDNAISTIEVKRIRVALALLFLSPKQINPARKGNMIATASKVPSINSFAPKNGQKKSLPIGRDFPLFAVYRNHYLIITDLSGKCQ
jgi:hypothetical protein